MKKLLLGAVALGALAMASPGFAADMQVGPPGGLGPNYVFKPVPSWVAAPVFNWNGPYLGFNLGGGWEHGDIELFNSSGVLATTGSQEGHGFLAGGQVGWNWMAAPGFLLGIEADADLSGIRETNSGCTAIDCFHSRLHDFGTVRGRVGYAWDQVLFYATGGWAWGFSKAERTVTGITQTGPVTLTASASGALSGWTAGGGIEWGFFRNWSVRVEYLHLEFDRVGRDFTFPGPVTFHINSDNRVEVVRVGMNYLFNWIPTPVFAKY